MFWNRLLPAIFWVLFIFVMCCLYSSSSDSSLARIPYFDKLVHFGFYLVLDVLLIRGLERQSKYTRMEQNAAFYSAVFCLSYGVLIEVLQAFVFTWRTASIADVAANAAGCAAGWLIITKVPALR